MGAHSGNGATQPLVEHWQGSAWSIVETPVFYQAQLWGVTGIAADDVWAVGDYDNETTYQPLILHWDGSVWSQIASPAPGTFGTLRGIAANSASDVWAVGTYFDSDRGDQALITHWDGQDWSLIPSPNASTGQGILTSVAAISTSDVWAVGYSGNSTRRVFILHWDGTGWNVVPGPNTSDDYVLTSISALSAADIWAVGDGPDGGFALHWNGTQWNDVAIPDTLRGSFSHVAAVSPTELWVVGSSGIFPGIKTLILLWDGTGWSQAVSPKPSDEINRLEGVAAVAGSPGHIWAVGTQGSTYQTLIARYIGETLPFTDVQRSDYFYEAVKYLYCGGLISGYQDETFRPNMPITRGQLSKVVANAFRFTGTSTSQTFEDVSPGSTFYTYVERVANRQVIGGYACGGASEPCVGPDNRPYFRPDMNATRGQIAKIVAISSGLSDMPGGQTFEDVEPGTSFYQWVETLAARNIMNGYACGGASEPCVGPDNRPYFRPDTNATRGQLSKIVFLSVKNP
ncbi:MAG TPA: S-layer homology domain-containing protein [Chloroflexia bacterium]